ncbi:ArnT family glycosyltransferase [Fontibacter flavus]|uniref:ArnT family glycosyltransferase n=1 Tax=Fontibacter flavus TaxID=654838 RepID=A0ABV6FXF7_9BACT
MKTESKFSIWLTILAFILLVGPFALSFHMHYPDEMYYSDAAVKMLQNGDIQTPYLGSEETRFKKPILTYWFVLAGFKIFGVTPFASRIFFLLAGALTIGFVFWASRVFFNDRKISNLAALIMASHPVLILSSTRSIPDVLLGFFMAMSTVGFIGFLKYGNSAPKKFHWLLFLGLALAFEVKGLPAAALGGLGILYLLLNPWQRIHIKKLVHFPSVLTAIVIASYWFVAMYWIHGATYLESFVEDQVGMRVASRFLLIGKNLLIAALLIIVLFVPWFIFGFKNTKSNTKKLFHEQPAFTGFVILWVIAILLMSAAVSKFYERYLLPVIPMTTIWVAWLLIRAAILERIKLLKSSLIFFLGLNIIVFLAGIFFNYFLPSTFWVWLQIAIFGSGIVYLFKTSQNNEKLTHSIALSVLLLFFGISISTFQISLPDAGQHIKTYARDKDIPKGSKIAFLGHLHTGSKIRIGLGPDYFMTDLNEGNFDERFSDYDFIIIEDKHLSRIPKENYQIELAALNWDAKHIGKMALSLLHGNSEEVKSETGKKFYWVKPI